MSNPSHSGYDLILARRSASARHLVAPGPDEAVLAAMMAAVAQAPDHGRLVPFRVLRIADHARDQLAAAWEAAEVEIRPDLAEAERERAREKAYQGPVILALVARIEPEHPKIPASDQWLSVGCALQSLLLAATAHGVGAAVRSGPFMGAAAMRAALGLAAGEHLVSFVALGTPTEWPPLKPKPQIEAIFQTWAG